MRRSLARRVEHQRIIMKRPRKQLLLKLGVFLLLGAIANVAVAWAAFPGKPSDWAAVTASEGVDQTHLCARGVPIFDEVNQEEFRSFGFVDRTYSTLIDPTVNQYPLQYARDTSCGWPCLALRGLRWSPIKFNEQKRRHEFTQSQVFVGVILVDDQKVMLGEREYLPIQPIWPGFAINTIFYAAMLWLLWVAPGKIRRFIRIRGHRCPACGYQIAPGGGIGPVCSECGAPLPWMKESPT
jgi:hypothetical protein